MAQRILILLLRFYQALVSPALTAFFGPAGRCRYTPSCSQYARESIGRHGVVSGGALAVRRLCRCHPWAPFGDDPVPPGPALKSCNAGVLDGRAGSPLPAGEGRPRMVPLPWPGGGQRSARPTFSASPSRTHHQKPSVSTLMLKSRTRHGS